MMDDADRRLIQAIQGMQDPDRDTPRTDEEDSDHDCEPQKQEEQQPPDMVRLQQDMALRQHLGIGGAFTGPKGVIADHKFHTQQELLRASQKLDEYIAKISKSALKSGSIARQIALESISNQDSHEEELLKIRATRRTQMHLQAEMSQVQTLTLQTFNVQIENEDPLVPVIVHIHTQSTACSHVNALLHLLAADYLMVKFATITAQEAADFDAFGTPAILMYQAGVKIDLQLPKLRDSTCTLLEFETFLVENQILQKKQSASQMGISVNDEFEINGSYDS